MEDAGWGEQDLIGEDDIDEPRAGAAVFTGQWFVLDRTTEVGEEPAPPLYIGGYLMPTGVKTYFCATSSGGPLDTVDGIHGGGPTPDLTTRAAEKAPSDLSDLPSAVYARVALFTAAAITEVPVKFLTRVTQNELPLPIRKVRLENLNRNRVLLLDFQRGTQAGAAKLEAARAGKRARLQIDQACQLEAARAAAEAEGGGDTTSALATTALVVGRDGGGTHLESAATAADADRAKRIRSEDFRARAGDPNFLGNDYQQAVRAAKSGAAAGPSKSHLQLAMPLSGQISQGQPLEICTFKVRPTPCSRFESDAVSLNPSRHH